MYLTPKPRRGRHRKPRTRRFPLRHLAAVTLAAVVVAIPSTANGDADRPARAAGVAELDVPPAPYHDGNPWPTSAPVLCLVDQTHGFPVEQAADAYADFVTMIVVDEAPCPEDTYPITVGTEINTEDTRAGWWIPELDGDGRFIGGSITLNMLHANRSWPEYWRVLLMHELGHAAGLDHTWEGESIMKSDVGALLAGEVTEQDREQLEQIYGGAR